jgi:hypothetical protein
VNGRLQRRIEGKGEIARGARGARTEAEKVEALIEISSFCAAAGVVANAGCSNTVFASSRNEARSIATIASGRAAITASSLISL